MICIYILSPIHFHLFKILHRNTFCSHEGGFIEKVLSSKLCIGSRHKQEIKAETFDVKPNSTVKIKVLDCCNIFGGESK